jgi:hypothetical protein
MTPPTVGPTKLETPNMLAIKPRYFGRRFSGTVCCTTARPPPNTAAAPVPAIARPRMKTMEDGAVALVTEPTSKINKAIMYIHLELKNVYTRPSVGCSAIDGRRNTLPYQPTFSRLPNSRVILGIPFTSGDG